jgi:tetratricopeptide (TPR) repeat protein
MPTLISSGPRVFPRIKFIWGSANVIDARWRIGLFGFYSHAPGFPNSGLAISVRGLLIAMLIIGVAGYVGTAAAVSRWLARNPHNRIGFTDVLTWPVRRERVAELRGRAWLAQGKEALKAKRWAEGFFLLRKGIEICPDDYEARFALVEFHLATGQRRRAMELLVEAPRHGLPPTSWRERVLAITAAGEDWQTTLLFCTRCLTQLRDAPQLAERQTLLGAQLRALTALDRAAEALAFAETEGETASGPVKMQRVNALRALGRAGEAAKFLARWQVLAAVDIVPTIVQLRAQALRENGQIEEMDAALAELRALHPARPEPLAIAIEQRARAGRGGTAALDDFLFRFSGSSGDLALAANLLAEIPDVALLQRVVVAAAERGYPSWLFRTRLAEALLRQGNWIGFAREVAGLEAQFARGDPGVRLWFEWMQSLSAALTSPVPGVQQRLVTLLQTRPVTLDVHRLTVTALHRAGRHETARDVLAVSRRLYAESPTLRRLQTEVDASLAAAAPTPKPTLPPAAAPAPANWQEFFHQLDEALAAQSWPEADRLIGSVRRARTPPEWFAAHEAELMLREIRSAQGRRDTPAFRLATRFYVNGTPRRSADVLTLARELHAAGAPDDAVLLVQAVLEKSPEHPMAKTLLAAWRPPAGKKAD